MKLKLKFGDGSSTTFEAPTKLDFFVSLLDEIEELNYLNDLFDIFMEAYDTASNKGGYKHRNPTNPDENFDLLVEG